MFGLGSNGQLGLGENYLDKVYKPHKVDLNGEKVLKIGLGDTHSILISENGHLMSTGANDKYQLG
jgi:alpha-tubulin suppressor-like RCC1 family protein